MTVTIAQTAASYYRSLDFDELDRGCGSMSSIALALKLRSDRASETKVNKI
ncbi:MAG: hypothetical protein HC849_34445 [Oscillatoriales cyanobacterium RU_3_3]|nr:hypothetical protein [Microcoleus sp. SU_5_3]NJM64089.1 hypothetical protein [Oscillatoriales cyanobacterium RU_3_3]